MTYWAVVQTKTQREHMVRLLLMRDGFGTYLPRIRHHSRIAPLFPSYLFVSIANEFYPVIKTVGVVRLLMSGDQPARLPDSVIATIHSSEKAGFVHVPTAAKRLVKGQNIRVLNGNFSGHVGLYDGMPGKQRARILLELLGQSVAVDLAEKNIEPLDVAR